MTEFDNYICLLTIIGHKFYIYYMFFVCVCYYVYIFKNDVTQLCLFSVIILILIAVCMAYKYSL